MSTVRQYELVYITPPEITEEALAELHQQVATVVDRFGGTIEKTENWGRRKLAYEINHQREGVYVLEVINGPGPMLAELDRRLRVVDQVVRHMLVRVDEDLAVADRARARRKTAMAARRVRRGLPPEPTETELHRRREEDDDLEGGDVFRGGDR
jgi:small subunit ribosomal protein S6